MMKRLTITGSTLRAGGAIRPLIDRVFPLTEAAAHALMESNHHVGKLLLQVTSLS